MCVYVYNVSTKLIDRNFFCYKWPMGGKAKFRYRLGMLKVNILKHRYLNVMKLENYGLTREHLNNN